MMTDEYAWWRSALETPEEIGKLLPVHDGDAQSGFYRARKYKDGPFEPVAIWNSEQGQIALMGNNAVNPADIWTRCCRHPITEEQYREFSATGRWHDEPPPIGHNINADDPHEALTIEYEGERELAEKFLQKVITNEDDASKAAIWSKRLADIAKKATDHHKVEKQPHLDAGRAVDEKWRELKEGAKDLSTRLKRHLDVFLLDKQRKQQAEAERKRREAEEAAKAAQTDEQRLEAERLSKEADDQAARNSSAGRTGAKVALRTFVSAEITDFDKLLIALKDREEIRELVQSLANRAAKSGVELAGMKIKTEQRAA